MATGKMSYDVSFLIKRGVTLLHLVIVFKQVDEKIRGKEWDLFKEKVGLELFRPKLLIWIKSKRFVKKIIAIQAIQFIQDETLEDLLLPFLKDPSPLVRLHAMLSAVKGKTSRRIFAVLEAMAREETLGRYAYRDALLQSDYETYAIILKKLEEETDPEIRTCCLEILSQKAGCLSLGMIQKDLSSYHLPLRWYATHALTSCPSAKALEYLIKACDDPDWQIQAEACRSLLFFKSPSSIPILEKKLTDNSYFVRLHAALTLKKMGKEGGAVLEKAFKKGIEIAGYVLQSNDLPFEHKRTQWLDAYSSSY
jgi:HEAT repeat protein